MIRKLTVSLLTFIISAASLATELSLKIDHIEDAGKVFISGLTNLPVGTKIGVTVSSDEIGFSAQDYNIYVGDGGQFQSEGFTNKGNPLVGNFRVELFSYFTKIWQDQSLLKKLVDFEGKEIRGGEFQTHYSMVIGRTKELKSLLSALPNEQQLELVEHYCYAQQGALLCDNLKMRVDTGSKIEQHIGAKVSDSQYNNSCRQGLMKAFDDENNGLCSTVWLEFGCKGNKTSGLVQENPLKNLNAILCEY